METSSMPTEILAMVEGRITWVLDHPGMSRWLKDALRSARGREPLDVLDDLEILNSALCPRAEAELERRLGGKG